MDEEEEVRRIAKSVYISEIPEGGRMRIVYRGRAIASRRGSGEIQQVE